MREDNLQRLSYIKISKNNPGYLGYKFLFSDLKNAVETYAKGDVLDIGCGNKPYYSFFEGKITSYIGCDVVQSDQNKVDILCLATDIPLPDNSKDTVFTTQVIEHVADHKKLLSESYRILKPGGYLILSGPMAWEHHEEPFDFFRFTKYGFEYILTEAGYKNLSIIPNGGKWAMLGQLTQNTMRSSFEKKGAIRKLFKTLYFIFRIKWIINAFYGWLDKVDKDYSATLNFVVVAQKQ